MNDIHHKVTSHKSPNENRSIRTFGQVFVGVCQKPLEVSAKQIKQFDVIFVVVVMGNCVDLTFLIYLPLSVQQCGLWTDLWTIREYVRGLNALLMEFVL